MSEPKPSRKDRLICLVAGGILLAGMAAYAPKAMQKSVTSDFGRYYTGGCRASHAGDIYASKGDLSFGYLPVVAQCFSLLARPCEWLARATTASPRTPERWLKTGAPVLPETPTVEGLRLGAGVWYGLLCLSYLACIAMSIDMCRLASLRQRMWLALGAVIVSARFFLMNVRLGQLNMFVMFWALLGCWLIVRRRHVWGGVSLGLAIALKIIPGGLLLWLLWRRNWTAAISLSLCGLFLLLIAPMATWGIRGGVEKTYRWFARSHHWVSDLPAQESPGQSLSSMANRFLRKVSAVTPRRRIPLYINFVDSPRMAKIAAGLLLALACLVTLTAVRGSTASPPRRGGLEVGLMFLLLLLISPESRRAHFVTMLIPAVGLMGYALSEAKRKPILVSLGVMFALTSLTSSGIWGYGDAYYYMNAYGIVMAGALVLFFMLRHCLMSLPVVAAEREEAVRAFGNPE